MKTLYLWPCHDFEIGAIVDTNSWNIVTHDFRKSKRFIFHLFDGLV